MKLVFDISVHNIVADYALLASTTDGGILRAAIGTLADKLYKTHKKGMDDHGIPRLGVYHFYWKGVNIKKQVEKFFEVAAGEFPIVDIEQDIEEDEFFEYINYTEQLFGIKPMIYGRASQLDALLPGVEVTNMLLVAQYPLSTRYTPANALTQGMTLLTRFPIVPKIGQSLWHGFQFTARAEGKLFGLKWPDSKDLDLSLFPDEVATAMLNKEQAPGYSGGGGNDWDNVPVPVVEVQEMTVLASGLNIRKDPKLGNNVIKIVPKGTKLPVTGFSKDTNYLWGETGHGQNFAVRARDGREFAR